MLFAAAVILVLGLLYFLSTTGKKPPFMPADAQHMGAKTKQDCLACHGPGMVKPMTGPHPPKDQCPECHKFKAGNNG